VLFSEFEIYKELGSNSPVVSLCRLEAELNQIVDRVAISQHYLLHFRHNEHSCLLANLQDIRILFCHAGQVNCSSFKWFRYWCILQYPSDGYVFCSLFFLTYLKTSLQRKHESYMAMMDFLNEKFKMDSGLDTLIVSICHGGH